jgi:ADP-ribose pyrophosphatase
MTDPTIRERQEVYRGKVVSLELDTLEFEDGRRAINEVIRHRPSVAMVPIDEDGRIVLVRQFRAPAGGNLLEVPAGSIDPGEALEASTQRELQEEIGMRAASLARLGGFYLAPGYCDEFITIMLCEGLSESRLPADEDEVIEIERLTLAEALAQIESGVIRDAKSISAVLLYMQKTREATN